jgi:hypothetical protein
MSDYQQYNYPPTPPPYVPPKKKRHTGWFVAAAAVGAVIVVGAVAGALGSGGKKTAAPAASTASSSAPAAPPVLSYVPPVVDEPSSKYVTPKKGDFTVTLKVLSKECFGTAGCNVEYRAKLAQSLPTGALDPDVTYDLTYVVHGDESGPQTETMYITGDQYEQPMEGIASTPSSGTKLTVTVTKLEAE